MSEAARYAVTANRLNLRAEPGTDSRILSVLRGGTLVVRADDLESAWWKVVAHDGASTGFVARRYLAPLSTPSPVVPGDAEALLWSMTANAAGRVAYELGAKHSAQGKIDCSGWVCELTHAAFTAVNAAAAPEVIFERSDFGALVNHSDGIVTGIERRTGFALHGASVTLDGLRPGMLIGCNFGTHAWERGTGRVYGIDHIVQVIRDPQSGLLWISQSSSTGHGVNRIALADWLGGATQAKLRQSARMHAVDPFLMADRNTQFVALSGAVKALTAPAPAEPVQPAADLAPVAPPAPAAGGVPTVSAAGYELIVEFEVSGRAHYDRELVHPIWPGVQSGVTIGIGHDLAHTTEDEFDRNWAGLAAGDQARLRATIGKAGAAAKACIPALKDIVVPWSLAEAVYRNVDMPKTAAKTARILPNCDKISGDCFGVLVSLSYNRGLSYRTDRKPGDTIDRYKEMRAIYALMAEQQFDLIPAQIRSMKRIWQGTSVERGLSRRREAEAVLFERGLREAPQVPVEPEPEVPLAPETTDTPTSDESFANTTSDEAVAKAKAPFSEAADAQADMIARAQVVWASDDRAFDYAHLQGILPQGTRFSFRAGDLGRLHELNTFPTEGLGNRVIFGLRGCGIIDAPDGFTDEVVLVDRRPDHQSARCVMGVWDLAKQKIAVFPASTVPNAKAVVGWRRTRKSGNLLPTGFYRYITGTHNGKPGCLLLRKAETQHRTVVVRRSSDNLRYDRTDDFDTCAPGDNIHPSFYQSPDDFSSFGCQVVVGSANSAGTHTGHWAQFRAAAGLPAKNAKAGQPFCYMLLTGAEASLASALRRAGKTDESPEWASLRRLRFGSHGDAVTRLQTALGLPEPDGDFGPNTSRQLHKTQADLFEGRCDGILSPELAEMAGWEVF